MDSSALLHVSYPNNLTYQITSLQMGKFDVILDKGGLDAIMEPEAGTKLGTKCLNEVCELGYAEF